MISNERRAIVSGEDGSHEIGFNHPKSRKNLGFDGIKYMIYVHIYKIFLQDRLMIETRSLSKFSTIFCIIAIST